MANIALQYHLSIQFISPLPLSFLSLALTIIIPISRPFGGDVVILVAAAIALIPLGLVEEVDEEPQRLRGLPRLLLHPLSQNIKLSLPNMIT